jgi:hypothetical protein
MAIDIDGKSVEIDDALHEGKTESIAFIGARVVDLIETINYSYNKLKNTLMRNSLDNFVKSKTSLF